VIEYVYRRYSEQAEWLDEQFAESTERPLGEWMSQYLRIARVALRAKPELCVKLGGVARSTRTATQRQAPKKAAATRAQEGQYRDRDH
jgi:hypothetical protein